MSVVVCNDCNLKDIAVWVIRELDFPSATSCFFVQVQVASVNQSSSSSNEIPSEEVLLERTCEVCITSSLIIQQ